MKKQKLFWGGTMIFIALLSFQFSSAFADIVIKNGSSMKVSTGTSVVVSSDVTIETGATLDNDGTVSLKGGFTNNGTASLGSGTFVFNGTAAQSIAGTSASAFEDLTINNSSGVSLAASARVEGTLTLTDGLFGIGTNNLVFGTAATAVAGTPSASNMIVADNSGEVRKEFSDGTYDPAAWTFTIGDNTGTAEYSPVVMDFNSSTFSSAYASVRVTNAAHPDIPTADDYLGRYWSLGSAGITDMDCDLVFTFTDDDVTGDKANLYTLHYVDPSWINYDIASGNTLTAFNVASFSDWSGASRLAYVFDLKAFLEGPYSTSTNEMNVNLNAQGLIPLNQAYNVTLPYYGLGTPRWYYTGNESVASIPAGVVDWILVQVRYGTSPGVADRTKILGTIACFIKQDGSIVSTDGSSPIRVDGIAPVTDNIYVVLYHRNHIGVISNNSISIADNGLFEYDYSTSGSIYQESSGAKQLSSTPGVWGLMSGDADGDGNIFPTDVDVIWYTDYGINGYSGGDFDMDGNVFPNDMDVLWYSNYGKGSSIPE